jgi:hypothetical protein
MHASSLVAGHPSVKANTVPVRRKTMPTIMSRSMYQTSDSFGVAMDEQATTSGAVVAACCCYRLLVDVDSELLIAEEEADLMTQ